MVAFLGWFLNQTDLTQDHPLYHVFGLFTNFETFRSLMHQEKAMKLVKKQTHEINSIDNQFEFVMKLRDLDWLLWEHLYEENISIYTRFFE